MKMIYHHIKGISRLTVVLLSMLMLTACEHDMVEMPQASLYVMTEMAEANVTRTTATSLQSTTLNQSITAGVCVYLSGKTTSTNGYGFDNITYTYVNGGWKYQTINFPLEEEKKLDIYVYAPRMNEVRSMSNIPVTVATNQATDAGYLASDFVFGNSKEIENPHNNSAKEVSVKLFHAMSKIILKIQDKDGGTTGISTLSKVELGSTRFPVMTDAYVNITGNTTSNTDLQNNNAVLTGGTPGIITLMDVSQSDLAFEMAVIIPPQSLGNGGDNLTLYFTNDGHTSAFEGNLSGTFLPGYVYTYTIVVDQSELTIMNASIVPWGTTDNVSKVLSN